MYKVQEAAKIAGVSVRTLHHYDHVGLLKPSTVGENRYRYYSDEDLKFLQHILFFKEIGFSLKKIQEIAAGGFDSADAFDQHIALLRKKKEQIEQLIRNAERSKEELLGGAALSKEERFAAFSAKQATTAAAADRYINGPEPQPEQEETRPADETEKAASASEEEVGKEADRIYSTVASYMHLPPETAAVQSEMEAYYRLLNRSYECTPDVFRRLGDLYVNDARFTAPIDRHAEGLAEYLRRAMTIYADGISHA